MDSQPANKRAKVMSNNFQGVVAGAGKVVKMLKKRPLEADTLKGSLLALNANLGGVVHDLESALESVK